MLYVDPFLPASQAKWCWVHYVPLRVRVGLIFDELTLEKNHYYRQIRSQAAQPWIHSAEPLKDFLQQKGDFVLICCADIHDVTATNTDV